MIHKTLWVVQYVIFGGARHYLRYRIGALSPPADAYSPMTITSNPVRRKRFQRLLGVQNHRLVLVE